MSGVIHPVGPEPARTYWLRRGVLLTVVLLIGLAVVFAVASLTKAAVATAPPPVLAPPASSASPSPTTAAEPDADPAAGATPTTRTASPSAGGSAAAGPASAATRAPSAKGSDRASSAKASTKASDRASTARSAQPAPTPTVVGTPDCHPAALKVRLKGDRTLSPGQNNKFTLALSNPGKQTCLISVTDKNFELKIYSGKDRIWSSRDCTRLLADFDKKLASKADVAWTVTWDGERSVKGKTCQTESATPRPGTYWATAQLRGAKPVQLRMVLA